MVSAYEAQRGFNYTVLVAARPDTEFASPGHLSPITLTLPAHEQP